MTAVFMAAIPEMKHTDVHIVQEYLACQRVAMVLQYELTLRMASVCGAGFSIS